MLIDTHAHLNFKAFDKDVSEVIHRAKKSSVNKIIIPGAKIDSSRKSVLLANKFTGLFAAVGIHPHHVKKYTDKKRDTVKTELNRLATNYKVVAIGEIGLDYHHYKNYPSITEKGKSAQTELFLLQIEIALKHKLPIIIHNRNASKDILNILSTKLSASTSNISGVFHCFSASHQDLIKIVKMGFYIGFDGNITYKENSTLRSLVKATPLNRMLLETDSPFLSPEPQRGKRNEPAFLSLIADEVARIHNIPLSSVIETTTTNAKKLFSL